MKSRVYRKHFVRVIIMALVGMFGVVSIAYGQTNKNTWKYVNSKWYIINETLSFTGVNTTDAFTIFVPCDASGTYNHYNTKKNAESKAEVSVCGGKVQPVKIKSSSDNSWGSTSQSITLSAGCTSLSFKLTDKGNPNNNPQFGVSVEVPIHVDFQSGTDVTVGRNSDNQATASATFAETAIGNTRNCTIYFNSFYINNSLTITSIADSDNAFSYLSSGSQEPSPTTNGKLCASPYGSGSGTDSKTLYKGDSYYLVFQYNPTPTSSSEQTATYEIKCGTTVLGIITLKGTQPPTINWNLTDQEKLLSVGGSSNKLSATTTPTGGTVSYLKTNGSDNISVEPNDHGDWYVIASSDAQPGEEATITAIASGDGFTSVTPVSHTFKVSSCSHQIIKWTNEQSLEVQSATSTVHVTMDAQAFDKLNPSTASGQTITYSIVSGQSGVVNQTGGTFTFKKGTYVIRATAAGSCDQSDPNDTRYLPTYIDRTFYVRVQGESCGQYIPLSIGGPSTQSSYQVSITSGNNVVVDFNGCLPGDSMSGTYSYKPKKDAKTFTISDQNSQAIFSYTQQTQQGGGPGKQQSLTETITATNGIVLQSASSLILSTSEPAGFNNERNVTDLQVIQSTYLTKDASSSLKMSFDGCAVGETSEAKTFIVNFSNIPDIAVIAGGTNSTDFSCQKADNANTTIGCNCHGNVTYNIFFQPTSVGNKSATFTFKTYIGGNAATVVLNVSGTGYNTPDFEWTTNFDADIPVFDNDGNYKTIQLATDKGESSGAVTYSLSAENIANGDATINSSGLITIKKANVSITVEADLEQKGFYYSSHLTKTFIATKVSPTFEWKSSAMGNKTYKYGDEISISSLIDRTSYNANDAAGFSPTLHLSAIADADGTSEMLQAVAGDPTKVKVIKAGAIRSLTVTSDELTNYFTASSTTKSSGCGEFGKAIPTISWENNSTEFSTTFKVGVTDADLHASSSISSKPVSYATSNTNVATIANNSQLHCVAPGLVTITAQTAGDDNYESASELRVFTVNLAAFEETEAGNSSNAKPFIIADSRYSGSVTVTTSSNDFEVSADGSTDWGSTATINLSTNSTVYVRFSPTTGGSGDDAEIIDGTLTFTSSVSTEPTSTVAVSGSAKAAALSFGSITIGQASSSKSVDVASGTYSVTAPNGYLVSSNNTSWATSLTNTTISSKLYIKFQPNSGTNDYNNKQIQLTKNGKTTKIKVSGTRADAATKTFSATIGQASANQQITLGTNFTLASATVSVGSSDYLISTTGTSGWSTQLKNVTSKTIYVKYQPSDNNANTGDITITSDGKNYKFAVSGTPQTQTISFDGITKVGETSSTYETFTLTNLTAFADLTVNAPKDFVVSNSQNGTYGSSCTITKANATGGTIYVKFAPQSKGVKSETVTITDGGTTPNMVYSFTVKGTAYADPTNFQWDIDFDNIKAFGADCSNNVIELAASSSDSHGSITYSLDNSTSSSVAEFTSPNKVTIKQGNEDITVTATLSESASDFLSGATITKTFQAIPAQMQLYDEDGNPSTAVTCTAFPTTDVGQIQSSKVRVYFHSFCICKDLTVSSTGNTADFSYDASHLPTSGQCELNALSTTNEYYLEITFNPKSSGSGKTSTFTISCGSACSVTITVSGDATSLSFPATYVKTNNPEVRTYPKPSKYTGKCRVVSWDSNIQIWCGDNKTWRSVAYISDETFDVRYYPQTASQSGSSGNLKIIPELTGDASNPDFTVYFDYGAANKIPTTIDWTVESENLVLPLGGLFKLTAKHTAPDGPTLEFDDIQYTFGTSNVFTTVSDPDENVYLKAIGTAGQNSTVIASATTSLDPDIYTAATPNPVSYTFTIANEQYIDWTDNALLTIPEEGSSVQQTMTATAKAKSNNQSTGATIEYSCIGDNCDKVSISGSSVTFSAVGTYAIRATASAVGAYSAAVQDRTFVVRKAGESCSQYSLTPQYIVNGNNISYSLAGLPDKMSGTYEYNTGINSAAHIEDQAANQLWSVDNGVTWEGGSDAFSNIDMTGKTSIKVVSDGELSFSDRNKITNLFVSQKTYFNETDGSTSSTMNFGEYEVGSESTGKTISFNYSNIPDVQVTTDVATADFTYSRSVSGGSLVDCNCNGTITYTFTFKPQSSGEKEVVFTFKTKIGDTEVTYSLTVKGKGKQIATEIKYSAAAHNSWTFQTNAGAQTVTSGKGNEIWAVKNGTTTNIEDFGLGSGSYTLAQGNVGTSANISISGSQITIGVANADNADYADVNFKVTFNGIANKVGTSSAYIPVRINKQASTFSWISGETLNKNVASTQFADPTVSGKKTTATGGGGGSFAYSTHSNGSVTDNKVTYTKAGLYDLKATLNNNTVFKTGSVVAHFKVTISAFGATTIGSPSTTGEEFVIDDSRFTGAFTITPPAHFEVKADGGSWTSSALNVAATTDAKKFYVRYNPTAVGTHSGDLEIKTTATPAVTETLALSGGKASLPTLPGFPDTKVLSSSVQSYTIPGGLGNGLTIDATNADGFFVSNSETSGWAKSITANSGSTIYIKFQPITNTAYSKSIKIGSSNTLAVSGTGLTYTLEPRQKIGLAYNDTIDLSGFTWASGATVTVGKSSGNTEFIDYFVSADSITWGTSVTLTSNTFYVKFQPSDDKTLHSGTIKLTSDGKDYIFNVDGTGEDHLITRGWTRPLTYSLFGPDGKALDWYNFTNTRNYDALVLQQNVEVTIPTNNSTKDFMISNKANVTFTPNKITIANNTAGCGFRIGYFPMESTSDLQNCSCYVQIKDAGGNGKTYTVKVEYEGVARHLVPEDTEEEPRAPMVVSIGQSSVYKFVDISTFRGFGELDNGTATVEANGEFLFATKAAYTTNPDVAWDTTIQISNGSSNGFYVKYVPTVARTENETIPLYVKDDKNYGTSSEPVYRRYEYHVIIKGNASEKTFANTTVGGHSSSDFFIMENFMPKGELRAFGTSNFEVSADDQNFTNDSITVPADKKFWVRFSPTAAGTDITEYIKMKDVLSKRVYEMKVVGTATKKQCNITATNLSYTTAQLGTYDIVGTSVTYDCDEVADYLKFSIIDDDKQYLDFGTDNKLTIKGAKANDDGDVVVTVTAYITENDEIEAEDKQFTVTISKIVNPGTIAWTSAFQTASNDRSIPVLVRTENAQTELMDVARYNTVDLVSAVTKPTGGVVTFSVDATTASNGSINNSGDSLIIKRGSDRAKKNTSYEFPILLHAKLNGTTIYKSQTISMNFYAGIVDPYPIWLGGDNHELKKSDGSNYRYGDVIQLSDYFTHTYRYLPEGETLFARVSRKQPNGTSFQLPKDLWELVPLRGSIDDAKIKVLKAGTIQKITLLLSSISTEKGLFPFDYNATYGPDCPRVECGPGYGVDLANDGQRCINITFDKALNNAIWRDIDELTVGTQYDINSQIVTTKRNEDDNEAIVKTNISYTADADMAQISNGNLTPILGGVLEVAVNDTGDNDYYEAISTQTAKKLMVVHPSEILAFNDLLPNQTDEVEKTLASIIKFNGTSQKIYTNNAVFKVWDAATSQYVEATSLADAIDITGQASFKVQFAPTTTGNYNGILFIIDNIGGVDYAIKIEMTGLCWNPSTIVFGSSTQEIEVGTASAAYNLGNNSDIKDFDWASGNITVSSSNPYMFRAYLNGYENVTGSNTATSISNTITSPNGISDVRIKFVPEDISGSKVEDEYIYISYTQSGLKKTVSIPVKGYSKAKSLEFGSKQLATFAARQTIMLTNMVTSSSGGFTVKASDPNVFRINGSNAASVSVVGGGQFTVDFFPQAVTSYDGTITILDNATSKSYVINATGSATANTIAFGQVQKGSSKNESLGISNLPDAASFSTKYDIESSSTSFAVSGATATGATITFTPTQIGTFSGTIYLKDRASGALYPLATVSGSCVGATSEDQYIIWNQDLSSLTGSGSVQLSAISTSGLPVTYSISNITGSINSDVSDGVLKFTGVGTATVTASCEGGESSTTLLNYGDASSVSKNVVVYSSAAPGISECVLFSIPSQANLWVEGYNLTNRNDISTTTTSISINGSTNSSLFLYYPSKKYVYNGSSGTLKDLVNPITYGSSTSPSVVSFDFIHQNIKECKITLYANGYPTSSGSTDQTNVIFEKDFDFRSSPGILDTAHISATLKTGTYKNVGNNSKIYCRVVSRHNSSPVCYFINLKFCQNAVVWTPTTTTTENFGPVNVGDAEDSRDIKIADYQGMNGVFVATITGDDADCFRIIGSNTVNATCSASSAELKFKVQFVPTKASASGQKLHAQLNVNGPSSSQNVTINLEGTATKRDLSLNWSYATATQSIDAIKDNNQFTMETTDNPSVTASPSDLPASVAYYPFSTSSEDASWLYTDTEKQKLVDVTYSDDGKYVTKVEATGYGTGTAKITATVDFDGNSVLNSLDASKDLTVTVNKVDANLELSTNMSSSENLYFGDLVRTTGAQAYMLKADGTKSIIKDYQGNELFTLVNGFITCSSISGNFINCTDRTSDHSMTDNNKAIEISKVGVVPKVKFTINNAVVNSKTETINLNDNTVKKIPILIKNTLANSQDKMQVYFDEGPIDLLSTVYLLDRRHSATTVSGYDVDGNVVQGEGVEAHWQGPFLLPSDGKTYPAVKEEYSLMSAGTFGGDYYKYTSTEKYNNGCTDSIGNIVMSFDSSDKYKRSAKLNLTKKATGTITVTLSTNGVMSYSGQNNTQFYDAVSKTFQIEVLKRDPDLQFTTLPPSSQIGYGKSFTFVAGSTYSIKSTGAVTYAIAEGYEDYATIDPNTGYLMAKQMGTVRIEATIASTCLFNDQTITSDITIGKANRGAKWYQDNTTAITLLTKDNDFKLPAYTYYSYKLPDGNTQYKRIAVKDQGTLTYSITEGSDYAEIINNSHLHIKNNIGKIDTAGVTIKVKAEFTDATLYNDASSILTITLKPANVDLYYITGDSINIKDFTSTTKDYELLPYLMTEGTAYTSKYGIVTTNYPADRVTYTLSSLPAQATIATIDTDNKLTAYRRTYIGTKEAFNVIVTAKESVTGSEKACTLHIKISRGTLTFSNNEQGGQWRDTTCWSRPDIVRKRGTSDYNVVIADSCFIGKDSATVKTIEDFRTHTFNAACCNLTINQTGKARIVIGEASTLNVDGELKNNNKDRLYISSNKWGQATVVFKKGTPKATIEMFVPGGNGKKSDPVWQYRGICVAGEGFVARGETWKYVAVYRWNEEKNNNLDQGCWELITTGGTDSSAFHLTPWTGYAFANLSENTMWLQYSGTLLNSSQNINLSYHPNKKNATDMFANVGMNLITNSYTVPLLVTKLGYPDQCEKGIVLYNAGSHTAWTTGVDVGNQRGSAGQHSTVPKETGEETTDITTIPSGQSFFVKALATEQTLGIVYGGDYYTIAPSDRLYMPREDDDEHEFNILTIKVRAKSDSLSDEIYLVECEGCTRQYDNGYDGKKVVGKAGLPQMYAYNKYGITSVNADSTMNKQYIGFQAGNDDETYTISFETDKLSGYHSLYLVDRKLNESVDILAGETYSFKGYTVGENMRFQINGVTEEEWQNQEPSEEKDDESGCDLKVVGTTLYVEGYSGDASVIEVFDMTGNLVWSTVLTASRVYDLPEVPQGVYMIRVGYCSVKYTSFR